jgi:FKBP-type peptidyl-prolyl cis-trans isomerase FkpA
MFNLILEIVKEKFAVIGLILLASCLTDDFISPQKQLKNDIQAIDSYLTTVTLQPGEFIIKDASGVRLIVQEIGTDGFPPNTWNTITVDYTGRLLSTGAIFDNGTISNDPLSRFITGWIIGMPLLPNGSKAKLYIPSVYAYGNSAVGSIPANSNLIFEVDLNSVGQTQQQIDRFNADITTINNHIATNSIENTIVHESGIRYVITQEGDGDIPTWYDKIKITYKAKLLNGNEFVNQTVVPNELFSSRLVNYPQGLSIAMQLLKEGGKGTFYVPSTLAYGPTAYTNLPANSVVIFEVDLVEILP